MPKYQAILIEKLRSKLVQRGNRGLIGLAHLFKQSDLDGSGKLDCYEFTNALELLGLQIGPADIQSLFKSFDKSNDGDISYEEFIGAVKGPLNEFRADIVLRIFKHLDVAYDGFMTV
jgi:Ca2+-binding EF-hand superfamily protein